MAWTSKKTKRKFVDYWLILKCTDLITNEVKQEYYFNKSTDTEPDIFVDKENGNELDKEFWTGTDKDTFDSAEPELMRSVEYTPTEAEEDQVKTEWVYYFSFRYEDVTVKVKSPVTCATCEYYVSPTDSDLKSLDKCDYKNGMYYYCPGYPDLRVCHDCKMLDGLSIKRCSFHAKTDSVTGKVINGDCLQWNRGGECKDWKEGFFEEE